MKTTYGWCTVTGCDRSSSGLSTGVIIGIVAGVIIVIAIIGGIYIYKRKKARATTSDEEQAYRRVE